MNERPPLEWLNYHHLHYFWVVAREGTITRAGALLRLAQPTISGQLHALEASLGEKLFERRGRTLQLTEVGHVVYRYAEEIFGLGRELQDTLKGRPTGRPMRVAIGIADSVPKLIAYRLLEPALRLTPPVQLACTEDKTERLLAELSVRGLDLVLTDTPIGAGGGVRAFNHALGDSGVSFFGTAGLRRRHPGRFPACLDGAPLLVPTTSAQLRRDLDRWLEASGVRPRIVAEFEDGALMKMFGQRGEGFFPGPTVIEKEIKQGYGVSVVGRTAEFKERFFAITVERRIKHPAVAAITETARARLFHH